jgi:hypothetical protein
MKKIKLISSIFGLMALTISCTEGGIDKDNSINAVSSNSNNVVFEMTTDNSVKIIPTGDGVSFNVIYGHANAETTIATGNSAIHAYPEGNYTVTIISRDLAGSETSATYPLKVTYKTPENFVVTVGDNFTVKAVAKYVKSFLVYYGDVTNEIGTPLAIGKTLPKHVYPLVGGPYEMKVIALSGGVAQNVKTLLSFPINFDNLTTDYLFNTFGNVNFSKVTNPDPTGINTSAMVGKYTKLANAESGSMSGAYSILDIPIDMAYGKKIKVWVYNTDAANVGKKLNLELNEAVEKSGGPTNGNSILKSAITQVNAWEELVFDFSTIPAIGAKTKFNELRMRFNDPEKGKEETIYIDNIRNTN